MARSNYCFKWFPWKLEGLQSCTISLSKIRAFQNPPSWKQRILLLIIYRFRDRFRLIKSFINIASAIIILFLLFLSQDSNNERVHFNLGMLAMDDHDSEGAERWFRNAVALKEDFRSALFNLALLLADEQRPLEAAPFLNQLVRFHPDHVKGLILLGDIYINNIKDLDAAENVSDGLSWKWSGKKGDRPDVCYYQYLWSWNGTFIK